MKERYRHLIDSCHAQEQLIQSTLQKAGHSRKDKRSLRPHLIFAVIFLLTLTLSSTAIAYDFDLSAFLQRYFPDTAADFTAVNLSDTEQGITMTVMQANLTTEGDVELLIEISGEQIDDSAMPHFYTSSLSASVQGMIVEYDKPNAILWRQRGYAVSEDINWFTNNGLYTVTMYAISLGRRFFPTFHESLDLTALPIADTFENHSIFRHSGSADTESQICLVPGKPIIEMAKDMAITAFGFTKDGYLVIQIRSPMNLMLGEGPDACLIPLNCAEDDWQNWVMWTDSRLWIDDNSTYYYCENIYPITADELGKYKLRTYYYTVEEELQGDWSITIDFNSLTTKGE